MYLPKMFILQFKYKKMKYIFFSILFYCILTVNIPNIQNIETPANLVRSQEDLLKKTEKGFSNLSETMRDDGQGYREKIRRYQYENVIKLDKWIKLKGNFYVCGTNNDIVNVYQCYGICKDKSNPIPNKKKVKICNYSYNQIKYLLIIGSCKCKEEKYQFKNEFNGQFESPFGTFLIDVNLEQQNDIQLKNSKFNVDRQGNIQGDSNVEQSGQGNLQIDSEFIPSKSLKNLQ